MSAPFATIRLHTPPAATASPLTPKPITTVNRPYGGSLARTPLLTRSLPWWMTGAVLTGPMLLLVTLATLLGPAPAAAQPDPAFQPPAQPFDATQPDAAPNFEAAPAAEPVPADAAEPGVADSVLQTVADLSSTLGYWAIPFGIATIIAVWFATERLVVLRRGRVIPKPFVNKFLGRLEDGDLEVDEAFEACEDNNSPIAQIFAHGVRKWGKPSVEVEQAIIDGGERQVAGLRKHLRVIHGIATVTPLIGLLGTVWGMYQAFNDLAAAGGAANTEELARGIALALVTTAAGLLIAIPCLIAYMYLSGRVDSLVMEMDDYAQRVVNSISAEAINETVPVRRVKKKGA